MHPIGPRLAPRGPMVSRFERRTPITPRIRAGLEPLGRHDRRYQYLRLSADTAEANRDLWAARVRKVALRPVPRRPATACGKQAIGQIGPHDRPRRPPTSKRNPGNEFGVPPPARHPGDDVRARPGAPESSRRGTLEGQVPQGSEWFARERRRSRTGTSATRVGPHCCRPFCVVRGHRVEG